ncbi:uncharacterized protein GGS22DRAFT_180401 [Annulohypoxylon maeteangense]|uniref:uncharacterized protein n=1 Tax=Annulohypoxylon maeteangense TaxID=1927788 RepID=UPI002008A2DC|nr:uncharacterized protein GGS22DRAFT_180401 [Annulohypoxylon maeteangense]KAI0883752.1 hypothetical protein GGS22DRAFT_180401 [Annulohypoxylon maeteangense]
MMCNDIDSLPSFINSSQNGPYNSSIASSASSSAASVWSEASSQSSDDTTISTCASDSSEQCASYSYARLSRPSRSDVTCSQISLNTCWPTQPQQAEVPQELRRNPRRTNSSASTRTGCPPPLVRQSDRKVNFVDSLVDSSTQIVEAIWPLSSVFHRQEMGPKAVLPLRTFIQETLRRSRTSYSTLQVALYYLILIKPHVPKHDFTMEQPDDVHASRVLQCGRRMFLAALILASKYLQDRNYSARAWSKISGLATQEINQNEMAFLEAVKWKLHITDVVFKRWTEIVLKHTPSQPPSSGSACSQIPDQQHQEWRDLILNLEPELNNIEDLIPLSPSVMKFRDTTPTPSLSAPSPPSDASSYVSDLSTPKTFNIPFVMEPAPATVHTPGRFAPALGLLPTPRLTPQSIGFSTPAATVATCLLSGKGSMGFAMAQAANVSASQTLDRWPGSMSSSPMSYVSTRRSSLANSISTASSPESMISDSSRTSRSSSISSASSLASAPSTKLDVQARCRYAKLCERQSLRPVIAPVPEDYEENCITSSPESYTGTVGKDLVQMSMETPLARGCELDDATNAARALQELQSYPQRSNTQPRLPGRLGSKRSRPTSIDNSLQENVREMLSTQYYSIAEREGHESMVRGLTSMDLSNQQTPVQSNGGRKRFCCATDARSYIIPAIHPAVGGPGGPGMWEGILR